jgi:D-beta-D-heptose 7-phosphate kinase/D-beta-D-heptose 1-phosphate adenosyltransferase
MVVFTNGVFDLFHFGHLVFLERARQLGTRLVVGVNSDESARALKGPGRPIVSHFDRLAIIQSLRCVDEAHVFHELTPAELIERLNPDLVVKGGDYRADQVVSCGRKVAIIPFVKGYSTSDILKRIIAPS